METVGYIEKNEETEQLSFNDFLRIYRLVRIHSHHDNYSILQELKRERRQKLLDNLEDDYIRIVERQLELEDKIYQ